MEWQPIEAAPEEGAWALVYADGAMCCMYVKRGKVPENWNNPVLPNVEPGTVTHWMPLPPPPEADDEQTNNTRQ